MALTQPPLRPHDVESLDDDGQPIYIEVKATPEGDPTTPFEISEAELRQAIRQRDRYFIYRVVAAHTSTPDVIRYRDPIARFQNNQVRLRLSSARLEFASAPAEATEQQG